MPCRPAWPTLALLLAVLSVCSVSADPVDMTPLGDHGTVELRDEAADRLGRWLDAYEAAGEADPLADAPARSLSWLLSWWWRADPASVTPDALTSPRPTAVFFVGDAASYLWSVTETGVTWHRRPGRAEMHALVDAVLTDLGRPGGQVTGDDAARLADLLVGPVASQWPPGRELQFLADDVVWPAPLAALPDPRDEHGRPLIWFAPVRWLLSWDAGQNPGHHPRQVSRLLATGHLGAAADLAHQLADRWPGESTTVRTGEQAGWSALHDLDWRAYDAILLADPALCDGTALVVGEGTGPDDLIPLSAMANRHTARPLVMLPSCGLQNGHALCTALGQANVLSVVMGAASRDEAADAFARTFFRYWHDGSSAADALRMSQIEMSSHGPTRAPAGWARYRLVTLHP